MPHSDPPTVVIKSVNPEYQTRERDADQVNITGRVIWAAKRLSDGSIIGNDADRRRC